MEESTEKCYICRNTREWHQINQPRHGFVRQGESDGLAQLGPSKRERDAGLRGTSRVNSRVKVMPGLPSDPALRVLMLRKGLITPDELSEVEVELRQAKEAGSIVVVMPHSEDSQRSSGDNAGVGSGDSAS